jgi:hypothetical protein
MLFGSPRRAVPADLAIEASRSNGTWLPQHSMDSPAAPLDEATAITSDAQAALSPPCGALQQRSVPSAGDAPATTAFALEALPPDVARRILGTLACPEYPGAPQRLRALQPAALTCHTWRGAARQLVRQLTFKGSSEGAGGRNLSVFPELSRLVLKTFPRDEDAAQLLLTLAVPDDPALSAAASAVSGSGSQTQGDRPDGVPGQQRRASVAGGGCFSGRCGGLQDICGGTSIQVGSGLSILALPLPLPAALTSLTRLSVSLLPANCTSGPPKRGAGAPGRRLAAALDALPLLVHLNLRDAPLVCAELAEALPRAARLRELVVGCEDNFDLRVRAMIFGFAGDGHVMTLDNSQMGIGKFPGAQSEGCCGPAQEHAKARCVGGRGRGDGR